MSSAGAAARGMLLSILLALPACGDDRGLPPASPHAVSVRAGERFRVRLDANPTTGLRWRVATPPDPAMVTVVGSTFEAAGSGRTGGEGEEVWTFAAAGPGRTRVVLEYVQPWAHDVPAARTHTLDVTVQSAGTP